MTLKANGIKISSRNHVVIPSRPMFEIFCDFDGTITNRDSIVFLTERHGGGPEFRRQAVEAIKDGRITVFEAIRRELESVRLSWPEARRELLANVSVDSTFPDFVNWCRLQGWPLSVVSSGLEPVVSLFVGHLGVPIFAHPVECRPEGWIYRKRESHDKVAILKAAQGRARLVYVGDGASDLQVIPWVDHLFACKYLAEYCQSRGLPHLPFETFSDVRKQLAELGGVDA